MRSFHWRKWIYATAVGIAAFPVFSQVFDKPVIYGKDNRLDLYNTQNTTYADLARSTLALVGSDKIQTSSQTGYLQLDAQTYGAEMYLCKSERFYEQWTAAFCSGFLVREDIAITAGHCIKSLKQCQETAFVFDFSMLSADSDPRLVPESSVYQCAELIHTRQDPTGADFAVIRLDRAVTDRPPLPFRKSGQLSPKDPLFVIGHPSGLPTKIADGASVRSIEKGYFVSDLDTFHGSSGSAVFNAKTGQVEGILVRGETDFVFTNGCFQTKYCEQFDCRGEDATQISEALQYLN